MAAESARGRLRLIALNGVVVDDMQAPTTNGENERFLSEPEGEEELIRTLSNLRRRLDPATDLSLQVASLLAYVEHRAAARGTPSSARRRPGS